MGFFCCVKPSKKKEMTQSEWTTVSVEHYKNKGQDPGIKPQNPLRMPMTIPLQATRPITDKVIPKTPRPK